MKSSSPNQAMVVVVVSNCRMKSQFPVVLLVGLVFGLFKLIIHAPASYHIPKQIPYSYFEKSDNRAGIFHFIKIDCCIQLPSTSTNTFLFLQWHNIPEMHTAWISTAHKFLTIHKLQLLLCKILHGNAKSISRR